MNVENTNQDVIEYYHQHASFPDWASKIVHSNRHVMNDKCSCCGNSFDPSSTLHRCMRCLQYLLCHACVSTDANDHVDRYHSSHPPLCFMRDDDPLTLTSHPAPPFLEEPVTASAPSRSLQEAESPSIDAIFADIFTRFAARPCLGIRPSASTAYSWFTYRQVYTLCTHFSINFTSLLPNAMPLVLHQAHLPAESVTSTSPSQYFVAILSETHHFQRCLAYWGMLFASSRRLVPIPINTTLSDDDVDHILNLCDASVVIASQLQAQRALKSSSLMRSITALVIFPSSPYSSHEADALKRQHPSLQHIVSFSDLTQAPPPDTASTSSNRDPGPASSSLLTFIFTSGSTGRPKGIAIHEQSWSGYFRLGFPVPHIKLSYTFAEARNDLLVLSSGGQVGLYNGDLGALLSDLQALRPSLICTTPRLYHIAYTLFQDELASATLDSQNNQHPHAAAARQRVIQQFSRCIFGDRIAYLKVGGAPCSPEVLAWMRECWSEVEVSDSYGASEVNGIARDGMLVCGWCLEDWESYRRTDQPHPRGELLVRAPQPFCYWRNPEANQEAFTEDGYYRTGDIVALTGPHRIEVIDRKKHLFKLNFGVFVAPEKIEVIMAASIYVDQICILPDPTLSFLIAIVVPRESHAALSPAQLQIALLQDLTRIGMAQRLLQFEIPRAVIIDPVRFSPANGQMTEGLKMLRHHIRDQHALQLASVSLSTAAAPDSSFGADDVSDWLHHHVPLALGVDSRMITAQTDLTRLGLTSMGSIRLLKSINQRFNVQLSLKQLFHHPSIELLSLYLKQNQQALRDESNPLTQQENNIQSNDNDGDIQSCSIRRPVSDTHSSSTLAIDWDFECQLDPDITVKQAHDVASGGNVLITGSTGFLGAFLLAAILKKQPHSGFRVYCVIRAADATEGLRRIQLHLESFSLWTPELAERIVIVPSDLHNFGARLTAAQSDSIHQVYHCAAQVNSVLPYFALKDSNVEGTRAVLRFCACSAVPKHLTYISTLSVLFAGHRTGRHEEVSLEDQISDIHLQPGYHQSKYVAERLVQEAKRSRHLPVTICRPGMISACSTLGACNAVDSDTLLIRGIVQMGSAPLLDASVGTAFDQTPVDYVAEVIATVGLLRIPSVFHFGNPTGSADLGQVLAWLKDAYPAIQMVSYPEWVKHALSSIDETNPLHPLVDSFFQSPFIFPARTSLSSNEIQNTLHYATTLPPQITQTSFSAMLTWLTTHGLLPHLDLPLQGDPVKSNVSTHSQLTIDDIIFW